MGRPKRTLACHTAAQPFVQALSPAHKAGMLAAHTRNAHSLSDPSNHAARGFPDQDAVMRTPLWSKMMKALLSGNRRRDPKQEDGNNSGQLALSPQVLICPPPLVNLNL
ncbi:hypothetical protein O181_031828, partial [Austropuccinia psidii MF-1]|nr:hypothetical protein [Austropuccinia psidii MF-1]